MYKYYRITEQSAATGRFNTYTISESRYIQCAYDDRSGFYSYSTNIDRAALEGIYGEGEVPVELLEQLIAAGGTLTEVNGEFFAPDDAPSELEWADDVHGHDRRFYEREEISEEAYFDAA